MIQQRKNPVKRAFNGLVGLPPEPGAQSPPSEAPHRGRPAKGEKAMTPAERVRKHRENKRAKQGDQKRRDLVAQLVRIIKRSIPFTDLKHTNAHFILAERRQRIQTIHNSWVLLPLDELKKVLAVYEEKDAQGRGVYIDSRGRLPGETSGEASRKNGMSGVEQQIAVAEDTPALMMLRVLAAAGILHLITTPKESLATRDRLQG
jgi:hypothetical protein